MIYTKSSKFGIKLISLFFDYNYIEKDEIDVTISIIWLNRKLNFEIFFLFASSHSSEHLCPSDQIEWTRLVMIRKCINHFRHHFSIEKKDEKFNVIRESIYRIQKMLLILIRFCFHLVKLKFNETVYREIDFNQLVNGNGDIQKIDLIEFSNWIQSYQKSSKNNIQLINLSRSM